MSPVIKDGEIFHRWDIAYVDTNRQQYTQVIFTELKMRALAIEKLHDAVPNVVRVLRVDYKGVASSTEVAEIDT